MVPFSHQSAIFELQNFEQYPSPSSFVQLAASLMSEILKCWVMRMTHLSGAKYTTDNLSMNCCISFIVNKDVGIVFNRDLIVTFHEQRFLLVEYSLCIIPICRLLLGPKSSAWSSIIRYIIQCLVFLCLCIKH